MDFLNFTEGAYLNKLEFVEIMMHPAGRVFTSDWFINMFIIIFCEDFSQGQSEFFSYGELL